MDRQLLQWIPLDLYVDSSLTIRAKTSDKQSNNSSTAVDLGM